MKKYTLLFPLFSPFALAETVIEHNTDPISFERQPQAVKFEQDFVKKSQKTTAYQAEYSFNQTVEQQINQAILSQNWENLAPLLSHYQQMPNVDPLLWHYAQAALAYAKKDHHSAIFHYRQLLARNPNLVYPRFDLPV
ncbi:MAG: hypothetical protein SOS93_09085 [Mannheimia varigena]|nr:hypothetical protein [Mannheimia varigena]